MPFTYNAFSQDAILAGVNDALSRVYPTVKAVAITKSSDNLVHLKTQRGATLVAILGSFSPSMFFIRGIHRIRRRFTGYTYLFNGQAGQNLDTLAFFGESGTVFYADADTYRAWLKAQLPHVADQVIDERVSREGEHNPRFQIVASH